MSVFFFRVSLTLVNQRSNSPPTFVAAQEMGSVSPHTVFPNVCNGAVERKNAIDARLLVKTQHYNTPSVVAELDLTRFQLTRFQPLV